MDINNSEDAKMEVNADQECIVLKSKEGEAHTVESETQGKQQGLENTQNTNWGLHNGPVSSDVMPNGDGLAEGLGGAEDTHMNGSSSPVNSQTQEPSPGVAAYPPMMLEKSVGASAEVTVHKGDALQSLRLSMPMQETELCIGGLAVGALFGSVFGLMAVFWN